MSIERTTIRTPLGLRFRDAATERPVRKGISVRVWPAEGQGAPARGVRTRSGAWAVHGLAHLRGYERSGNPPASKRTYIVDVRDERDRYVPEQIRVGLPPDSGDTVRGIYSILETPEDEGHASNGEEAPDPACYLFPSVARRAGGGFAAVRADLRTPAGDPAGHAVLEVRHEGDTWYGLADDEGRVAVLFPYPAVELASVPTWDENAEGETNGGGGGAPPGGNGPPNGNGGPPRVNGGRSGGNGGPGPPSGSGTSARNSNASSSAGGSGRTLATRTWELSVTVRYAPTEHARLPRSGRPFLTSLLGQSSGEIRLDAQHGFVQNVKAILSYGRPLPLRSQGRSHLIVRATT